MSHKDDTVRLSHMLEHAREAVDLLSGKSRDDLDSDRVLGLALVRLLEVIGEAANRVSEGRKGQLDQIPWPEIVGLRNRLIHGYDEVDLDIVWEIIQQDLPVLVTALEKSNDAGD